MKKNNTNKNFYLNFLFEMICFNVSEYSCFNFACVFNKIITYMGACVFANVMIHGFNLKLLNENILYIWGHGKNIY